MFFIPNLFASTSYNESSVDLYVTLPSADYTPIIYYDGVELGQKSNITDNNNKPFVITKDGDTLPFTVYIIGNEGVSKNIEITITGSYFQKISATNTVVISDVYAYPQFLDETSINTLEKSLSYIISIPRGLHTSTTNILASYFKLSWNGNSDIESGSYKTSIDVSYSVID